ncbi:hypothetical protein O2N63_15870 [Aliiroseovarius sp. KMU-50]|uniref:PepSY domain-containing protein n=1 Tax=Aliiroseovarius salicola TaxID=3009082 RepID=A0ABT4W6M6_9RHOB|nr:PepSY domain-containing protein [Aliiroseovarius sp. KMU-50]MDA5095567.1 hypothetical protein [Aliiroseovarius sp. KMU-50]
MSRPSIPRGDCQVPAGADHLTISRRDYQRAQTAIRRGEARPLDEIVKLTRKSHPGQPVSVGFSTSGPEPIYQIQIVTRSGTVISVTVAARSGRILKARTC